MTQRLIEPELEIVPLKFLHDGMAGITGDEMTWPHARATDFYLKGSDVMGARRQRQQHGRRTRSDCLIDILWSSKVSCDIGDEYGVCAVW